MANETLNDCRMAFDKWLKVSCDGTPRDNFEAESWKAWEAAWNHRPCEIRLLSPDMPTQELKLHMGELTAQEQRTARAAIRWANNYVEGESIRKDETRLSDSVLGDGLTPPSTPTQEILDNTTLTAEALETLKGMAEFCINQGYCMGMDEGTDENGNQHPFVKELLAFSQGKSSLPKRELVDDTLPKDVHIGAVVFKKGVKLDTLINAATRWHKMASDASLVDIDVKTAQVALDPSNIPEMDDKEICLSILQDKFDSLYVTMKIIEERGEPDDEAVLLAKQALSEIEGQKS